MSNSTRSMNIMQAKDIRLNMADIKAAHKNLSNAVYMFKESIIGCGNKMLLDEADNVIRTIGQLNIVINYIEHQNKNKVHL